MELVPRNQGSTLRSQVEPPVEQTKMAFFGALVVPASMHPVLEGFLHELAHGLFFLGCNHFGPLQEGFGQGKSHVLKLGPLLHDNTCTTKLRDEQPLEGRYSPPHSSTQKPSCLPRAVSTSPRFPAGTPPSVSGISREPNSDVTRFTSFATFLSVVAHPRMKSPRLLFLSLCSFLNNNDGLVHRLD